MDGDEIEVLCPRCRVPMNYYSRTEKSSRASGGAEVKVTRFFKCPVCGKVIVDEEIVLRQTDEGLVINSKRNGLAKVAIVRKVVRAS
ncbi:MAG: hypothetical protein ACP5FT_02225 [Acidilobus sp.]